MESVAFGGSGVARVGGIAAFIPFTVDGDVVEAQTRIAKKKHLVCRLKRVVSPSPNRVEPPCPYFTRCGGCRYQHIDYSHQLAVKESQVKEALKRIGGFSSAPVRQIIASPSPYSYRGKAEFHAQWHRGEPRLGFFDVTGANVMDIDRCEILDESINRSFAEIRKALRDGETPADGRITLWSAAGPDSPGHSPDEVSRIVKGRTFTVPREGFFQGNLLLTERLVAAVLEAADCGAGDCVLDLYCGSGLFSLFLAESAASVLGIEIDSAAVECARLNARAAQAANAEFRAGKVESSLESLKDKGYGIILLDPPRAGCDKEVLAGIMDMGPAKVVYVSCDPATQARDLRVLAAGGFSLEYVQPLDMFPQTMHIETVAVLKKNRK